MQFHRFPWNLERISKWIAAIKRKDWEPTEQSWICSSHVVGGKKSDDPQSPGYVPSLYDQVKSPLKRAAKQKLVRYARVKQSKRRRIEAVESMRHEVEQREGREVEQREGREVERERLEHVRHVGSNRHSQTAAGIKDSFKDYFLSPTGEVSWQY